MILTIKELNIFPLKSARGIALSEAEMIDTGLVGDRMAMVCDPSGKFITQRQLPALATLNVARSGNTWQLSLDDGRTIVAEPTNTEMRVRVWDDMMSVSIASEPVNTELSYWLGQEMILCFIDAKTERFADRRWVSSQTPVTFADGFQVLVTTTASLAALNENLTAHGGEPVGMERFRANIVIENEIPWDEDNWQQIEIGGISIDLVKPCTRCIMTTQDQRTGSRDAPSPMPAMGRLRMSADHRVAGVLFGWNGVPNGTGTLTLGDRVQVTQSREESWPLRKRG
jgi:uncharacterized protein YcbX